MSNGWEDDPRYSTSFPLEDNPFWDEPQAEANGARRIRLTTIADVGTRLVKWLEPDLIARAMLTGLVAPGGTVKGLYGIHIATKIALRGERTLFVCAEDALDYIVRPRFEAAGSDARHATALSISDGDGDGVPHFPSDLDLLAQAIEQVRPSLVILDPIASYIDPGLDMSKNNEMRLILQPLIELAALTGVAILIVYHLGKDRERGALGSVAFEDACRVMLTAARDDEDEDVRHIEMTKSNISQTGNGRKFRIIGVPLLIEDETVEVAKLVDEGRSEKNVAELLAKRKQKPGPDANARETARSVLAELLVDAGVGGRNAQEVKEIVCERAAVSKATAWRAFSELRDEKLAVGTPLRDEFGAIREWRWSATTALLLRQETP